MNWVDKHWHAGRYFRPDGTEGSGATHRVTARGNQYAVDQWREGSGAYNKRVEGWWELIHTAPTEDAAIMWLRLTL